mmetsp:Transcript_80687/g.214212  ORF Transcript_80687/g.214212 Transcript_80687/m.214212 type:complete len:456 (-) Transcript_80687:91-1458(-)
MAGLVVARQRDRRARRSDHPGVQGLRRRVLPQLRRPGEDVGDLQRAVHVHLLGLRARQGAQHPRVQQHVHRPLHRRPQRPQRACSRGGPLPQEVSGQPGRQDRHHQQLRLEGAPVQHARGHRRSGPGCDVQSRLVHRPDLLRRLPGADAAALRGPPAKVHRGPEEAPEGQHRLLRPQPLRHGLGCVHRHAGRRHRVRQCDRTGAASRPVGVALRCRVGPAQAPHLDPQALRRPADLHHRGGLVPGGRHRGGGRPGPAEAHVLRQLHLRGPQGDRRGRRGRAVLLCLVPHGQLRVELGLRGALRDRLHVVRPGPGSERPDEAGPAAHGWVALPADAASPAQGLQLLAGGPLDRRRSHRPQRLAPLRLRDLQLPVAEVRGRQGRRAHDLLLREHHGPPLLHRRRTDLGGDASLQPRWLRARKVQRGDRVRRLQHGPVDGHGPDRRLLEQRLEVHRLG